MPVAIFAVDLEFNVVFAKVPSHWGDPISVDNTTPRPVKIGDCLLDHLQEAERIVWRSVVREFLTDCGNNAHLSVRFIDVARAPISRPEWGRVMASAIFGVDQIPIGAMFVCFGIYDQVEMSKVRQELDATRLDVARQLAVTLNHEINNPLFIISATLEDLLADAKDPAIERRLRASLDAVWRVSSAVKQLQDIRQVVSTAYIEGFKMIDLEASQKPREKQRVTD